jgi:hypothetical protein
VSGCLQLPEGPGPDGRHLPLTLLAVDTPATSEDGRAERGSIG